MLIGNTIMSLIVAYSDPIIFNPNFEDFLTDWWEEYGIMTVMVVILGIVLIMIGLNIYKRKSQLNANL